MKIKLEKPIYKDQYLIEIVTNEFKKCFSVSENYIIEVGSTLKRMQNVAHRIGNWCHKEDYFTPKDIGIIEEYDWIGPEEDCYSIEEVNIYFQSANDSIIYNVTLE